MRLHPETSEGAGTAIPTPSMKPTHYDGEFAMNMIVNHEDFNGLVNQALKTNSRIIAEKFGKNHKDVLRAIKNMECSADFTERNFAPSEYVDATGRTLPQMLLTRDGFTFLAMGFTGKEAAIWKEKFIAAFNAMEGRLKHNASLSGPQLMAAALIEADATMKAQAAQIEFMAPKAQAFDRLDTAEGNLTVRPAAKVLGIMETKLTKWLEINRWAFRQNGKGPLQAYADRKAAGLLDMKLRYFDDPKTGEQKVDATLVITPKGMARLAEIFNREGMQ